MRSIIFILLLLMGGSAIAQNELLAKNYFEQGEYEKAITIYEKLYGKNQGRVDYLKAIVQSNQQLENFQEAERLLKERLSSRRVIPQLYVDLGYNYSLQNNELEAHQNYDLAIDAVKEKKLIYLCNRVGKLWNHSHVRHASKAT